MKKRGTWDTLKRVAGMLRVGFINIEGFQSKLQNRDLLDLLGEN
jgi:hypothetical protein